jgi:hypothetical protein
MREKPLLHSQRLRCFLAKH